jgi:hypothetical protein
MALKTFLASASMNYGGKTGENQMRPTGAYSLSAIAANDANKVAMTWELDPTWVEAHAGKKDAKGPTWDLQEKFSTEIADGGIPDYKITFFMDADKAQSSPFQAMQLTSEEMVINTNGSITLDAHAKNGGTVSLSKNALGGYNYSGYIQAMNELGNVVNNPIFGTSNSDLNATVKYMNDVLAQASMSNMQQQATQRDPNNLQFDPTTLLETE